MIAYHNKPTLKAEVVAAMQAHRAQDALTRGLYWDGHRGCAVGCLTHDEDGGHADLAERLGIDGRLLYLQDHFFENLPEQHLDWPVEFLEAFRPGSDTSRVSDRFVLALLSDPDHGTRRHCCGCDLESTDAVIGLYERRLSGDDPREQEWVDAALASEAAATATFFNAWGWVASEAAWAGAMVDKGDAGETAGAAVSASGLTHYLWQRETILRLIREA